MKNRNYLYALITLLGAIQSGCSCDENKPPTAAPASIKERTTVNSNLSHGKNDYRVRILY